MSLFKKFDKKKKKTAPMDNSKSKKGVVDTGPTPNFMKKFAGKGK